MGPSKAIDRRGCRLKPSSVLITSMSAQSDGRSAQDGLGRFTRRPVFWVRSFTVNTSDGNRLRTGLSKSDRTPTPAAAAEGARTAQNETARRPRRVRGMREPPLRIRVQGGNHRPQRGVNVFLVA